VLTEDVKRNPDATGWGRGDVLVNFLWAEIDAFSGCHGGFCSQGKDGREKAA